MRSAGWTMWVMLALGATCALGYELVDDYYVSEEDEGWDDPYEQFDPIPHGDDRDSAVIDLEESGGDAEGGSAGEEGAVRYELEGLPENSYFVETFQGPWKSRWLVSPNPKYTGEFSAGGGANPAIPGDKGLIVTKKGRFYGLSTRMDVPDPSNATLVVQFEVKAEAGFTCSGAYLKLIAAPLADLESFDSEVPYSIMFGPDKCGENDFTRFVYQTKNPHTGAYTRHHLTEMPGSFLGFDQKTHLYTLILRGSEATGNAYEILIDRQSERKGSLWSTEDFKPARRPPKKVVDQADVKPDDWEEEKLIVDPEDRKPDDWDEAVRGAWKPRMIKNPKYKGVWRPRKIDNEEFYEVSNIGLLASGGIGIDLWAMDHSIMFDNILVTSSEQEAADLAEKTWRKKRDIENERYKRQADEAFRRRAKSRTLEVEEDPAEDDPEYEYLYVEEEEAKRMEGVEIVDSNPAGQGAAAGRQQRPDQRPSPPQPQRQQRWNQAPYGRRYGRGPSPQRHAQQPQQGRGRGGGNWGGPYGRGHGSGPYGGRAYNRVPSYGRGQHRSPQRERGARGLKKSAESFLSALVDMAEENPAALFVFAASVLLFLGSGFALLVAKDLLRSGRKKAPGKDQ